MPARNRIALLTICGAFIIGIADISLCRSAADDRLREIATLARDILNQRCFACHGANGIARKNVFVGDRDHLIASQTVVPGDPNSLLLRVIQSGAMPEGGPPLPDEERSILREWVIAGAPNWDDNADSPRRAFIDEQMILALIEQDLLNQPERSRRFLRYFSLMHLYNAGVSQREMETYREALSKLINSLSWHREVTRPVAVDSTHTLFRIDLRDYNWTSTTWDLLLSAYPYALRPSEESIVPRSSGVQAPYVRADWFAARASVPPLYHDLLALPRSALDLERMVGVDAALDLAEEKNVARAGLRASGVSQNNRVLERHSSSYGAYWKSFDFRSSVDQQNIFQHPLSFSAAGSEIIFNLPNGLQAYLVVDGFGRRLNEAPIAIVSNRTNSDDPVIRNGRSCMSCHYDGIRQFRDEARAAIQANFSGLFDRNKALAIYPAQAKFERMIDNDRERFRSALTLASGVASSPQQEPINALARRFVADLALGQAAAEAGLEPAEFRERLSRSARLSQLGYSQLLVPGGAIKRDAWDRNFDELVAELGLGRPVARPTSLARNASASNAERFTRLPPSVANAESILQRARTVSISSMTVFLKPDQLAVELRKQPEFNGMGLTIVKDAAKADLMIDLDRPLFTYTFTYSVSSADTRVVVTSGKVTAFDGNFAARKIAKELMKRIQSARVTEELKSEGAKRQSGS